MTAGGCAPPHPSREGRGCPACGARGRRVSPQTPRALVRPEALETLPPEGIAFCATPACPVVYHDGAWCASVEALRVPVFEKQAAGDRLVCYCLEIRESALDDRPGDHLARIRALIASGRCACELRNPAGRCCLARVEALAKR